MPAKPKPTELEKIHSRLVRKHESLSRDDKGLTSLSTGAVSLDIATGVGGWPMGRVIELYGPESCGKSTLALTTLKYAQQADYVPLYLDFEQSFMKSYAVKLGLDVSPDKFVWYMPDNLGMGAEVLEAYIDGSSKPVIAVVDSVPAMEPASFLEGDIVSERRVGQHAKEMGQMINRLLTKTRDTNSMVIFINHVRDAITTGYSRGPQETTPGGRALKFYASMRVKLWPIKQEKRAMKDHETGASAALQDGIKVQATVVKNKVANPWRKATFIIKPPYGIDDVATVVGLSAERKLIKKQGSNYTTPEGVEIYGMPSVVKHYNADADAYRQLRQLLVTAMDATLRSQEERLGVVPDMDGEKEQA